MKVQYTDRYARWCLDHSDTWGGKDKEADTLLPACILQLGGEYKVTGTVDLTRPGSEPKVYWTALSS
jgi:hypothetical protein